MKYRFRITTKDHGVWYTEARNAFRARNKVAVMLQTMCGDSCGLQRITSATVFADARGREGVWCLP